MGQAWRLVRDVFRRAGFDTPELDARLLAELAFGMNRLELVNKERDEPQPEALKALQAMAERRLKGEPVVRIIGEADFFGLRFTLNEETLVPRPETELLVSRCLALLEGRSKKRILDLGTGSGCIAISILRASPTASAVAIDVSPRAIEAATSNAKRHGVGRRFKARAGSWFDPLDSGDAFDIIVSNPPYIAQATIETLAREVKDFDPRVALDGGKDGLDAYRAIVGEAPHWLKPDGWVVVEIGAEQSLAVKGLFEKAGLIDLITEKDLAGLDRMVIGHHF